jgi:protein arginine N-methyltransferase 1
MAYPKRADVIVSETLGNYAFEENIIDTLADARRRHLKDGGVIIPGRISQLVAPVVSDRIHRELTTWDDVGFGLDFAPARAMSLNNVYVRTLAPEELLDGGRSARVWDEVDFAKAGRSARKGEAAWKLSAAATVYGFAYWWIAELVPGVTLSTAPGAPRTHWEQLYFPLLAPIAAKKGETVTVSLRSRSSEAAGTHLAWTAVHFGRDGKSLARQAMDLDKGWLP